MKRIISTLSAVLMLAAAGPVLAQGYEPSALPPHEILTIVRSTGFDPIGQPMRRGPNYVLRAIDDNDREVNLLVSARSGAVLSATPIQTASRMPPSVPPGGSMGEWQRMPPGYIPPPGYRAGAPIITDEVGDEAPPSRPVYGVRPPAAVPVAPPPRVSSVPPPRAGNPPPVIGATRSEQDADAEPSGPNVIPADPQSGMLPPPPERFPQRAAPPAPPKPVKRAAAAAPPPKTAPLPKPKPAAGAAAPTPAAAPPQASVTPPAPAKAPAAEETPN